MLTICLLSTGVSTDCDTNVNYNQGCSIQAPTTNSYGPAFNNNGGGIYVMECTSAVSSHLDCYQTRC
jgi:hypothetical protein